MKKHRRSLAATAWDSLRRMWKGEPKQRRDARRLRRIEFLEPRQMLHGGGDPEYDPNTNFHIHYQLDIFVNGTQQVIPTGVGNNLGANSGKIHTHDMSGLIHVHPGPRSTFVTVGEFFDAWKNDTVLGNPNAVFSSTNLLGNTANMTHTVRMYVNGELNTDFQNFEFHDGDKVVISYEPTSQSVGSPLLEPISNQTLLSGSPLFVPLDGLDPQGQAITYTVSSSNSNVQASILSGNRSMQIVVPNFGKMSFQLFDHLASRATNAVAGQVSAGFYDGLTFHRIIDNFMIQGGSHNGSGGANPNVPDFDDQFHFDLQHNRSGLLSMAKSLDDSNDTQFFITDAAARHLDFNHSVFGILTDGEEVRNAINSVPTNASDQPLTPVAMESVDLVTDNQNGVLFLKAAPGVTSGSSTITVTATDTLGNSFSRSFLVTITADTSNSNPFLSDIPAIAATAGQPTQFQLVGNDIEGDAIVYTATKLGSGNHTVSVNSAGLVTVTPAAGFTGSFQVEVTAKAAALQSTADPSQQITDVQKVTVNVGVAAPSGVDLVAASDTGLSSTDNVTSASSLNFTVSGVTSGSVVKLFKGTTVLAQGTATGSTITLSVNSSALGTGTHTLFATQTVSGTESSPTANLDVTIDPTAPGAFTSTPPTTGNAGSLLSYDAQNPEEGTSGFRYSLSNAPAGATINPTTGLVNWTPTSSQVSTHNFAIAATDAAGNQTLQNLSVVVGQAVTQLAQISLSLVNASGQPISSLQVNQNFFLVAQIRDLRATPQGVFSFYGDLTWDGSLATVTGPIQFSSLYNAATTGNTATPGLIDEFGALANSLTPVGGGFKELFRVPMRATASGTIQFLTDPADPSSNEVTLYGADDNELEVPRNQVTFGTLSVGVAQTFTANNDTATVNEDSSNNTINVLANDTIQPGSGNVLTITSVGPRSNGGNVTIAADGKSLRYTPGANFAGAETFTYTVQNQAGTSLTATVTVTVNNTNDPPTATNDTFTVDRNTTNNSLNVLANDSAAPDANETLTVTAVGAGSQQGTISVAPGGTGVRYTPKANFTGTETFTYTISDGHGGTRQATVTVTVRNPGPSANNDTQTVQEDSSATTINVLANDTLGPAGGTLTVTSVGATNRGGTVTLGTGGANVVYTPAANFQGTETFTYTLSDGQGGTATGTVTVTVNNVNDAPTATNDTLDAFKNIATTLDVLANDVFAPDPTEAFTITAVTQPSHGTVTISADGKQVIYTPTTGYTGPDTFTYTMRDPGNLTSTATVTLTVRDFLPSVLGGSVFFDRDRDGIKDNRETGIAGVEIKLTGTAQGGNPVNLTTHTLRDGSYKFENLPPGSFSVQQTQPQFLVDGGERSGLASATVAGNDKFQVALAQGTSAATQLSFAELGKARRLTRKEEFFGSNLRNNVLAAIPFTAPTTSNASFPTAVAPSWQNTVGTQWSAFGDFKFAVSNDNKQLRVEVKNSSNQTLAATVNLSDRRRVLDLGTQNGQRLFRLLGPTSRFNFTQVQQAEGEGESGDALSLALASLANQAADELAQARAQAAADAAAVDAVMATL